ncbi:bacterial SH3 domain-containing protein [Butyrivibrio proteoclasticus B316]|uniref:Bacterial SH3 domain-containing protein n=1 Tax=Butyrivibrio proteoclasticus (strain ATCC 51982 / DSM 14932 / B316) TaxID=515622 RepID=E0RVL5_BUTPB|nr:SH3 domain-containing protein [Butyrivibrio proteoclasticus]ADL34864.1 bacterial SH3 domain-containing protein [Butyrivibrio proteoclasticus B316]
MKKKNYSFRNDRKNIFALLGDNKKYLMPILFVLAVILTVVIALNANKRTKEIAASVADASLESTLEITEVIPMAENAYEDVNYLINEYYTALANGDSDTIKSIYKGLEDTQLLKAVAASDYIEEFRVVTVYTKPGPVAGSYVAYVYNEVKLFDYDKAVPGLESLYICTDDNGNLYINGDIANANEIEYLKQVNLQEDVIDLNNKVATEYNEMVNSDEALAEFLTKMRAGLQVSVGEALASSEASSDSATEETSSDDSASEATSEAAVATVTTHTIRATDVINIRSSDSETADVISKTAKGEEFKQLEALANGWSKIEYKGGIAYVKTEFFEVVGEETTEVDNSENEDGDQNTQSADASQTTVKSSDTGKMQVSDTVRLRKSQSTESEVLEMIYSGSTVNVVEQYASGWAKVEYNKKTGYIKSEFLTKE